MVHMCCISLYVGYFCAVPVYITVLCFWAAKKKTKDKSKTSSVEATGPVSITESLGKPLQGRPLNEEMIVMEGNSNIPPDSADAPRDDVHSSDSSKRDDLW